MRSVRSVIDDAKGILQDEPQEYWTDADLVSYLNSGRLAIYSSRPRVYEVTEPVALVAGWRQTIPNSSHKLFSLIDNITAESRRQITVIDRELLGRLRPSWRTQDPSDEILHFMYTELEPTVFEVFPPALVGTQVRISYAKPPVALTLADYQSQTPVMLMAEAELSDALVDYILYRAYLKASDTSPDAGQRAAGQLQIFIARVRGETEGRANTNPNATSKAVNLPNTVNQ